MLIFFSCQTSLSHLEHWNSHKLSHNSLFLGSSRWFANERRSCAIAAPLLFCRLEPRDDMFVVSNNLISECLVCWPIDW